MTFKVFYIDDEEMLCENFEDQFATDEVEVYTFTDPEESLKQVNAIKPDLLFIDYRFPGTTGDEVAMRMPPAIPKALITGDIGLSPKYAFISMLQKPTTAEQVQQVLDDVCVRR